MSAPASSLPARWRSLAAPGIASLLAFALMASLGVWQLRRLEWKEAIIARIDARVNAAPAPLPAPDAWASLAPDDYEYRKVRVRGVFDHAREAHVFQAAGARTREPGFLVLTPLVLASGAQVVVNRGFVPQRLEKPQTRAAGQVAGEVDVTGLMRAPEARNLFTPPDQPDKAVFHVRDPASIAQAYGLSRAAPFTIDADETPVPGNWPQGGATTLNIPNKHLAYAWTWFGLAATLLGVFGAFAWRRLKGRD
ncbi:MAG: SURF1-like protein [Hyphomicrobiales bacterium]|nr:SURF1-like protein [Hyphomicrobiales bacterium]